MPMSITASFDGSTSRVWVVVSGIGAAGYVVVSRSLDQAGWSPVRGGTSLAVASASTQVFDHEFRPNVLNYYRAVSYDVNGGVVDAAVTTNVMPTQNTAWLKSVGRPFLNLPITITDPGEAERKSRSTAYEIVGSRTPIAVNDVHSSRERTISVIAQDEAEADRIDLLTSLGDILYLQMPPGGPAPSMYSIVGTTRIARTSRRSSRRIIELPLTEVVAPDSTVAASGGTWQTVVNTYPTWTAVTVAQATWQALSQLIGSPTDIVTG